MKLSELARNASRTQNRKDARKVAESLRFRMGMNYAQSMDWAKNGRIVIVAMIDDGTSREVLLSDAERGQVLALLLQMFKGRPLPVSQTELPLEPHRHNPRRPD